MSEVDEMNENKEETMSVKISNKKKSMVGWFASLWRRIAFPGISSKS